jgi:opacity protein-like surface antigen
MRMLLTAAAMAVAVLVANAAAAQEVRGFVTGGVTGDVNGERFPAFGGGAVVDLGTPWLSAGGQGEAFFSGPYAAGRGAVFGQGNIPAGPLVRGIVLGGLGFGEDSGPMFGGGLEIRPTGTRIGLRVTVEDFVGRLYGYSCPTQFAFCQSTPDGYLHQVVFRAGITF